jgi:ribose-phosphate pyrophosphokinase
MNQNGQLMVFATNAGKHLAEAICRHLSSTVAKISLSDAKVGRFKDGEVNVQIGVNVRDQDVFIICPTPPPSDNFFEAGLLADAARRSSARRVTYVIPYMGYARADRKSAPRMPIGFNFAIGTLLQSHPDRMIFLDIHAEQSLGSIPVSVGTDHLFGSQALFSVLIEKLRGIDFVIATPDVGGSARARFYTRHLSDKSDFVVLSKERITAGEVNEESITIIGDVRGKVVVLVDDIVDSGGTMMAGAKAVKKQGAKKVIICATHGIFSGNAMLRLQQSEIDAVYVTDSIWHDPKLLRKFPKIQVVSVSALLAEAIYRTHIGESLSVLIPH